MFTQLSDAAIITFMKGMTKLLHYIIVLSLVLFAIKPLLSYEQPKQSPATTQYSTQNKCSGTSTTVSPCQSSACYTLTEAAFIKNAYFLIFSGLLTFIYLRFSSNSPHTRLFKPPILSY